MRLSAIDALQHGLLNLRANWQLIFAQALQSFLILVISVIGLVPIVMVLGFTFVRGAFNRFGTGGEAELFERVLQEGVPLIIAFLATTLIWTVAFVVYCYMQGGILGLLAEGERQAVAAGIRWPNFRVVSSRGFFAHAERLTWPIFWLVNLFMVVALAGLLILLLVAVLLLTVAVGDGFSAGGGLESLGQLGAGVFLFGCLGFVVMAILSIVLSVWLQVALAELATGTRGVFAAARSGLATLVRRLPGLALLFLLLIVASIAMAIVTMPLSLVMEGALRNRMSMYLVGQAVLTLFQMLFTGIVNLGWSATAVALVAGEHERPV